MKESTETLVEPVHDASADGDPEPSETKPARSRKKADKRKKKEAVEETAAEAEDASPEGEASEAPPASDSPEDAAPSSDESSEESDDVAPEHEEDLTDEELMRELSALLFASPEPLSPAKLAKVIGVRQGRVKEALVQLSERLAQAGIGFEVRGLAGGITLMTRPELSDSVAKLSKHAAVERISAAALETLAVIAYRQPVTKAEIEAIRGVQAGPILRSLVDRGLAKVVGRSDVPGHPLQYGTTKEFLDRFGLESLKDLPRDGELARD